MNKRQRQAQKRITKPKASGYSDAGASITKRALRNFIARSGSTQLDIDMNNRTLRQRSRMLYMAAPVATSAINTARTNIVGLGLTLQANVDFNVLGITQETAKEWNRKVEAEFALWAGKKQNCDALGLNNFKEIQQLALKSWLLSGDVFLLVKRYDPTPLNPYSLRLHLIEADRISTPMKYRGGNYILPTEGKADNGNLIHDGVEVNKNGQVVAYYISDTYPQEYSEQPENWRRVEAYGKMTGLPNIIHLKHDERPEQYRGVPYLTQVIEPLLQVRRYTESELMAALIQSFFTAWIETETNPNELPMNETGSGNVATEVPAASPDTDSTDENEYDMGPGTVTVLKKDEKVVFGQPNIPTAGFETFVKTFCRLTGAALEIPYEVLLKEYNASYSASRAALLEAWKAFFMYREWFVNDACQPVYEIWLSEAIARGRIKAPGFFDDPLVREAYFSARWIGPVQGQIDPTKECEAAVMQISHGIKTHEQVTREMGGGDWFENVAQLKRENELLREAGAVPVQQVKGGNANEPD